MSDHNIDIDEVRDYLQDRLSPARKREIDEQIANDPAYAQEFDQQKELVESMTIFYRDRLKKRLQEEERSGRSPKSVPIKSSSSRRWWAMAASLVLIAVSGYFLFFSGPSSGDLFDDYYRPYYNVLSGGERAPGSEGSDAMALYDQGRYKEAISVFQQEINDTDSPESTALTFYLGLSYLASNQSSMAIEQLEKVISGQFMVLHEPAKWYLGLAYLQSDDPENAKKIFRQIESGAGAYQDKASEILEQLP